MPVLAATMLTELDSLPCIQLGDFALQLELGEADERARGVARRELREIPDVTVPAIAELKRLLMEDTELKVPLDNDTWLVRFLRPCKYYPESAYDLVKRYFSFKIKHSTFYNDLTPSNEQNIFNSDILTVLPKRDQLGRRILVLELGKKWKHNTCSLDEVFKGWVLFVEAAMLEPESQIRGVVVVFDMDGLSMQQVLQFTPPFAKRIVDWVQDHLPLRIKGIYVVNQPLIFKMVFALFKPFLREKLRSRIVFMGTDRKVLYEHISPKFLPANYGGTLLVPRVTGPQWLELLLRFNKEFEAINSYGYPQKEKK